MDYGQDGQACRQTFIFRITEGLPVIPGNGLQHIARSAKQPTRVVVQYQNLDKLVVLSLH
jgi:hypothetical protein